MAFSRATLGPFIVHFGLACCVVFGAIPAGAASYYVSTTGSDSSAGTLAAPFRTINKAASTAGAGSDVFVRAGTYSENVSLNKSGTASAAIRFQPYNGETVVIDGANLAKDSHTVSITGSYVEFRGFQVKNSRGIGIATWGGHHQKILNNVVSGSIGAGIWMGYDSLGNSTDGVIQGNTVFNNCLMNTARSLSGGWPVAIGVSVTDRVLIQNNVVYQNYGEGIGALSSRGTQILNNISYDNFSVLLYLDNCQDSAVAGNLLYATSNSSFYRNGKPAIGISQAIENTSVKLPLSGNKITNNVVIGASRGFNYGNYEAGGGLQKNLIANNTFVNSTEVGLSIDSDQHSGNVIANNIFYRASSGTMVSGSAGGFTNSNNCWSGGSAGVFASSSDVNANPNFVNGSGVSAANYKLNANSPCASSGKVLSDVTSDFAGSSRTAPLSAGAFETDGTGGSSPTPTPAPTPAPTATPAPTPVATPTPTATPSPTPVSSSGNLILNSGFESRLQSWSNWGNSFTVSNNVGEGVSSLRVGTGAGGIGQNVKSSAVGAKYTLTFLAKLSSANDKGVYIGMKFLSASGATLLEKSSQVTTTTYAAGSVSAAAPSGTTTVQVYVWKNAGSGYGFVDRLSLSTGP